MWSRFRACVVAAAVAVALTAGMVSLAPAATAASACPSVDQQTGVVTPAPMPGVNWSFCDLEHADLAGADLASASLEGADLRYANVRGANLTDAILERAGLGYAGLSGAILSGADMHLALTGSTDLSSADLTNADLSGTWMQQTNLDQADLAGANLDSVYSWRIGGTPTDIPASWRLINGYLVGPTADLNGANLVGADLSGMNLAGATLSAGFLSNADLAGADLKGADLYDTSLPGANLSGANLAGVDLHGVASGDVHGIPAGIPAPWVLKDGYFFGPHAYLANAHLSGLDLRGTDLAGAYFLAARLAGANLADVNLSGASMVEADLLGADLFGANIEGVGWHSARCPGGSTAAAGCTRAFDFAGFTSPRPGTVLRASARSLTAVFKLAASRYKRAPLTSAIASAIGAAHQVRVRLTGKDIKPVAGLCAWNAAQGEFRCRIAIPRHLPTGRSHPYHLTAQEDPNGQFGAAPTVVGPIANPATIYFR